MLRRTLLQLAFCTMMLAGCIDPTPVSLAGKQFRLIKLTFDNIKYKETICQFSTDRVKVWSYKDSKKWYANLIAGGYTINNRHLKLPFGEFETTRARDGYYLYANGVIRYKMVANGGSL